jgi:hypothetical protein
MYVAIMCNIVQEEMDGRHDDGICQDGRPAMTGPELCYATALAKAWKDVLT